MKVPIIYIRHLRNENNPSIVFRLVPLLRRLEMHWLKELNKNANLRICFYPLTNKIVSQKQ